jgi:hypothetical protein
MMHFRGGGVGHKGVRTATNQFLSDWDHLDSVHNIIVPDTVGLREESSDDETGTDSSDSKSGMSESESDSELVPHLDSESETEWDNQHDGYGSDIETRKSDSGEESEGDMCKSDLGSLRTLYSDWHKGNP